MNRDFTNWLPENLTAEEKKLVAELAAKLKHNTVALQAVVVMMLEECNYHEEAKLLNDSLI